MKAIVVFYLGSELNEYSLTRIAAAVNEHCDSNCSPQIVTLSDRDVAHTVVINNKPKESTKVDTSLGDSALIYVAEKFKDVWYDKTQLLIRMSRAVGQNKDTKLIKSLQILNDSSYPFQREVGRDYHYDDMQKYCVETIYNMM